MLFSKQGNKNYKLLKDTIFSFWNDNVEIQEEKKIEIPVDAFEIYMQLYGRHKVLLEYETGTFALKLWTGEKYEYPDKFINDKMVYGFDSMTPENIIHNFSVMDVALKTL